MSLRPEDFETWEHNWQVSEFVQRQKKVPGNLKQCFGNRPPITSVYQITKASFLGIFSEISTYFSTLCVQNITNHSACFNNRNHLVFDVMNRIFHENFPEISQELYISGNLNIDTLVYYKWNDMINMYKFERVHVLKSMTPEEAGESVVDHRDDVI
jgi:hypothetical protein